MSADLLTNAHTVDGVFERRDELNGAGHEQVVFCSDRETGLRAIIAIHDTTLGPGLGGTRMYPYRSEAEALTDCLRLSQGMTYKAAGAGLPLGGAKAVIIGDPRSAKTPELLRAYGRFVESLAGRYYTAADVGTTSDDLDVIGQTSSHVVGRNIDQGGSGDSGYSTAFGVFTAMSAAAERLWGPDGVTGRRVGVEGVGKVGRHLVTLLQTAGAHVLASDPTLVALGLLESDDETLTVVESVRDEPLDVYAPCALGGSLTVESVGSLQASLVCGAANNQLAHTAVAERLRARSIVWVPDFIANAGGLVQVGGELQSKTPDHVLRDVAGIRLTVDEIVTASLERGATTWDAALSVVEARLDAGRRRQR